jgi:hypothetical protein
MKLNRKTILRAIIRQSKKYKLIRFSTVEYHAIKINRVYLNIQNHKEDYVFYFDTQKSKNFKNYYEIYDYLLNNPEVFIKQCL